MRPGAGGRGLAWAAGEMANGLSWHGGQRGHDRTALENLAAEQGHGTPSASLRACRWEAANDGPEGRWCMACGGWDWQRVAHLGGLAGITALAREGLAKGIAEGMQCTSSGLLH